MVALVDGDENWHFGGFRMGESFQRLGHHAVVGGDHEHHDVGDVGTAGAHGAEGRMAGGVQESDLGQLRLPFRMGHGNGIGTDVLGDAAGFTGRHTGFADDVDQGGLAMVHVAHDGDHRRTRLERFRLVVDVQFQFLDLGMDHAFALGALFRLKTVAVMGRNLHGDLFINGLVHRGHDLQLHQFGDDGEGSLLQGFRQGADDNRRFEGNDLCIRGQENLGRLRLGRPGRRLMLLYGAAIASALLILRAAVIALRRTTGAATLRGPRLVATDHTTVTAAITGTGGGRTDGQGDATDQFADLRLGRIDGRGRNGGGG